MDQKKQGKELSEELRNKKDNKQPTFLAVNARQESPQTKQKDSVNGRKKANENFQIRGVTSSQLPRGTYLHSTGSQQLIFTKQAITLISTFAVIIVEPIEKNLKTRHKTSLPNKKMENEDRQITVWVCQEEKIVCELTKHTTSAEVIKALLEEHQAVTRSNCCLLDHYKEYCIVEKWKHFERLLPPSTKILKLWQAWGTEQINLSFVLVKAGMLKPCSKWNTTENAIVPDKHRAHRKYSAKAYVKAFPLEKQKTIVRNTFRKLAKQKRGMEHQETHCIKRNNPVLLSQDNIIKQTDKVLYQDKKIKERGKCQQLKKSENNGEHFACESSVIADDFRLHQIKYFPDTDSLEKLLHIEEELIHHHLLIKMLSDEIREEISSIFIEQNRDLCICDAVQKMHMETYTSERVQKEIDESIQVGLQLHSLFNSIQKEVQCSDLLLHRQQQEYKILQEELNSLCVSDTKNCLCHSPQQQYNIPLGAGSSKELGDITKAVSNMDLQNNTDSDTGISSTHSQD
ncbi:ras association domain-containing protein 9 [Pseudophryne corroboree]|uniref:ras association domain-containing protein 9 n=1 Tax=Pseudophryne corroboree TaxID=495146 RepID=UPI00308197C3